jgi:hypothetical protein
VAAAEHTLGLSINHSIYSDRGNPMGIGGSDALTD